MAEATDTLLGHESDSPDSSHSLKRAEPETEIPTQQVFDGFEDLLMQIQSKAEDLAVRAEVIDQVLESIKALRGFFTQTTYLDQQGAAVEALINEYVNSMRNLKVQLEPHSRVKDFVAQGKNERNLFLLKAYHTLSQIRNETVLALLNRLTQNMQLSDEVRNKILPTKEQKLGDVPERESRNDGSNNTQGA